MRKISKTKNFLSTFVIAFAIFACSMTTSVSAAQNIARSSCTYHDLAVVTGTYTGTCKVKGCNSGVYVYKCRNGCGYMELKCTSHHKN